MVTIELANTKGRAPYRPLAVSFSKLARSSRTESCWISFLNIYSTQVPTYIREYLLLTLIHVHIFSTMDNTGTHLHEKLTKRKESHRIKVYGESIVDSAGFIAQSDPYSSEHHAHSCEIDDSFSLDDR